MLTSTASLEPLLQTRTTKTLRCRVWKLILKTSTMKTQHVSAQELLFADMYNANATCNMLASEAHFQPPLASPNTSNCDRHLGMMQLMFWRRAGLKNWLGAAVFQVAGIAQPTQYYPDPMPTPARLLPLCCLAAVTRNSYSVLQR